MLINSYRISIWVIVSALVLLIGGCSPELPPPRTTANGEADNGPLHVRIIGGLYSELPDMNNAYWTELQKRLHIKLDPEWIPSGDFNTKIDLILASGNLPDIIAYPSQQLSPSMQSAIQNNAFWDLTPFLGDLSQFPNLKNNTPPNALKGLSMDGKIYALPRSRSRIDLSLNIRKDWLDQLNIPVPTTLDEYRDALKKIVDHNPSRVGTIGLIGHGVIINDGDGVFEAAFGAFTATYDREGGMIWHQLTDSYTEMVGWFRQLYSDGILAKDFPTMKISQAQEAVSAGRAASYVRGTRYHYDFETSTKKVQPEAKFIALPPLKGPNGYAVELSSGVNGGFYISKKVPEAKVRRILKYLEASASQEITDYAYNGVENVHYKVVNGQRVPTELARREINTTSLGVTVLAYTKWGKVDNPAAPKEYNDSKHREVADYESFGFVNPFTGLYSNAWTEVWPKYADEWKSNMTKAIIGKISMDEYRAYVSKLNSMPYFKKAYQELAKAYEYMK
ncbi:MULTISPECIES: extracellular solute-binding protein [unclassified Paenibacillus]|uniref:extracellular solute-binding protein n=1 Tax=unclassified Paenibacillus TaxID=185978 RepID=UPI00362D6FB4